MRIASFNLENLGSSEDLPARLAVLRPQLQRLSADVLCLQEVDASRTPGAAERVMAALDALLAGTRYEAFERTVTTRSDGRGPRDRHNLVIVSRWPAEQVTQVSNDLVPPPRYTPVTRLIEPSSEDAKPQDDAINWDRPVLHVQVSPGDGRPLHVINVHLKAPLASFVAGQKIGPFAWKSVGGWAEGYYIAAMKRAGQALEARLLIDRLFAADPDARIALCGDFNAEAHDVAFQILAGDTEDTGNGALTMQELIALEESLSESRRFTVIHGGRRQMLDHILVSRPLLALYRGIEVHNEALGDELVDLTTVAHAPESYHAPVVATFDLGAGLGAAGD